MNHLQTGNIKIYHSVNRDYQRDLSVVGEIVRVCERCMRLTLRNLLRQEITKNDFGACCVQRVRATTSYFWRRARNLFF